MLHSIPAPETKSSIPRHSHKHTPDLTSRLRAVSEECQALRQENAALRAENEALQGRLASGAAWQPTALVRPALSPPMPVSRTLWAAPQQAAPPVPPSNVASTPVSDTPIGSGANVPGTGTTSGVKRALPASTSSTDSGRMTSPNDHLLPIPRSGRVVPAVLSFDSEGDISTASPNVEASPGVDDVETTEEVLVEAEEEEEDPSIALARQLMEEEALMREDVVARMGDPTGVVSAEGEEGEDEEPTYDQLLELGERIGDVAQERWRLEAAQHIAKLPQFVFKAADEPISSEVATHDKAGAMGDSLDRCLVCQCEYTHGDELTLLPCKHIYHGECVGMWLKDNKTCPLCKAPITADEESEEATAPSAASPAAAPPAAAL